MIIRCSTKIFAYICKNIFAYIFSYIRLICLGAKSRFRSLLAMIFSALSAPLIIAAAFVAAGPLLAGAFTQPKLELVFCDLEGSAYFDTILNLLLADESVTKTVTIKKLGYDEALSELDRGAADAAIIFPEAFISDMSRGINNPIKILASESDPVRSVFIKEFIQSAADELSAAQSAINTVWFNMDLEKMSDLRRNMVFSSLVLEYTSKAFARGVYYTFQNVDPPYEGSSPAAFLTASALAAMIFFGALAGVKQILQERAAGITVRLAASGLSCARVALYHFAPIYLKQLMCACFALLIALPAVTVAVTASSRDAGNGEGESAAVVGMVIQGAESSTTGQTSVIGGVIESEIGAGAHAGGDSGGGANGDGSADVGGGDDNGDGSVDGNRDSIVDGGADISGDTGVGVGADINGSGISDGSPAAAGYAAASIDDSAALTGDTAGSGDSARLGDDGGASFSLADIPQLIKMSATKENAARLLDAFWVICVLCLFTSALALFCGCMLKRAESAETLIVTSGIVMAVAGGTVIPYPYMPEIFKAIGPFCFNGHAQKLIASALFGGGAAGASAAPTVFAIIAATLIAISVLKIKADSI